MPKSKNGNTPIHPVQKRDNYICQYCGKDGLASLDNWHDCRIDHFIPRKYGGTDDHDNLVTSCSYCNAIKGGRRFETQDAAHEYIMERRKELKEQFKRVVAAVRGTE